jgi:hypothetical protein
MIDNPMLINPPYGSGSGTSAAAPTLAVILAHRLFAGNRRALVGASVLPTRVKRTRQADAVALPANLPLGLSLRLAATVVGVSPNTYRKLERDKLMPGRKMIGRRRLYDRDQVLAAFKRLDGGSPATSPPSTVRDPATDHSWDDLQ